MTTSTTSAEIRIAQPENADWFGNVAADVFDDALVPERLREFLNDPRHLIVVARADGEIVGFVSAVHYVHPDKEAPELWINEVGVASSQQRRGIGGAMLDTLLDHARSLGCHEAWVLTDHDNSAALALYAACGGGAPKNQVMIEFRLDGARSSRHQAR